MGEADVRVLTTALALMLVSASIAVSPGGSAGSAVATSHDVCASGCSFTTIQAALDVAVGGDEITVGAGTFPERLTVPAVSPLRIVGAGETTILDAGAAGTALTVPAGVDLTVELVVIRNGSTAGDGAGVANDGTLTLRNVDISDNVAGNRGGGIYNSGTVVIEDSVIQRNLSGDQTAGDRGLGGAGIASTGPTAAVTVRRSAILENRVYEPTTDFRGGGAINSNFGDVTIEDSLIFDNDGDYSAGGIDMRGSGGLLTMRRTNVIGNRAGSGGGIVVRSSAMADIDSSLIAGNSVGSAGGGLRLDALVSITNTTISGNAAGSSGGGIRAGAGLTLDSVTITDNEAPFGGGVWTNRTVTADNSVIAGNRGDADWPDCLGAITTSGPLFVGVPATCTTTASTLLVGDPGLAALSDNGGPTLTHLPTAGSSLVDAGLTGLPIDQRGLRRPSGPAADLGAVEVQTAVDEQRPTFPSGSLAATNLQPTSVDLAWAAAADNVGVVGYEILDGKTVLASPGAAELSTTLTALTPDTVYALSVVAIDAAGNRSIDGPKATVTTPPIPPSGHLGPDSTTADPTWADAIPFSLVGNAASAGELLVVASSGSLPQVITQVTPVVPTPIDIDADGTADVTVTATPSALPIGPSFDLVVDRLTTPGVADVEVMAFIDLGVIPGSLLPNVLVNGFRTLAPDLGPGGTLPQQITLAMGVDVPNGLDHRLDQRYTTVGPTGPILLATGVVEGSDRVAADAAQILTMAVDEVPSTIETSFGLDASDVNDPANAGFDIGFSWTSPAAEPRPTVTFAYGERERRSKTPTEHQLTATFDTIAPEQNVIFRLSADPAATTDQAELAVEGASRAVVVDEVSVEYVRSDGIRLTGGMLGLDDSLKLSVDENGNLELGSGYSRSSRLFFEAYHPTRDFLGGALSNPIHSVFASVRDRDGSFVASSGTDASSTIKLSAGGYRGGELVVVAASDPANLGLPTNFPTTSPREWSFGTVGSGPRVVRVGVVDDPTRSTIALQATAMNSLLIDLDPVTLSQSFALDLRSESQLDARVDLAPGTPLGGKDGTEMSCVATLNGGPVSLIIEPPVRYGVAAAAQVTDIGCIGERGERTAELRAGNLAEDSSIELTNVTDTGGRFDLTFDDTISFIEAQDLEITVTDPRGLLPAGLLGVPTTVIKLFGDGIPSSSATWATGDRTGVVIAAASPEDQIEHLEVLLASEEPPIVEGELQAPLGLVGGAGEINGRQSTLRLWDTGLLRLLAGSAHLSNRIEAHHRKSDGGVAVELDVRRGHTFTSQLYLPARGHFAPQFTANGGCSLRLPVGISQAQLTPDRLLRLSNGVGFPGMNSLRCDVSTGNGPLGAQVTTTLSAGDLPIVTAITPERNRITIGTTGGVTGPLELALTASSGGVLAGQTIFGEPVRVAAVELSGARAVTVDWDDSPGGFAFDLSTGGTPLASFGGAVSSGNSVTFAQGPDHRLLIDDTAVSSALVEFADVESFGVSIGPGSPDVPAAVTADVATADPHPLVFRFRTDEQGQLTPGLDVSVSGKAADIPADFSLFTDLGAEYRFASSGPIDAVDVAGSVSCPSSVPGDPALAAICPLEFDLELRELPNTIDLGLLDLVRTGSSVAVRSDGRLGELDAVLRSGRPMGFFDTGIGRLRLLSEDVPLFLRVDVLEDPTTVGAFTVSGSSATKVGRLLVELEAADDTLFTLPYRRVVAQLAGLPTTWSVEVAPDASGDGLAADVIAGASTEGVDRVELLVNAGLPDDPGAFLNTFAADTFGAVTRSKLVRDLDNGYWNGTDRDLLAQLYNVGVPLQVASRPFGDAPDGPGVGSRTIAMQDHFVVGGLDDGEFQDLSFAMSGIHRVRVAFSDDDTTVSLQRPGTLPVGSLYVGATETAIAASRGLTAEALERLTLAEHRRDGIFSSWLRVFNDAPEGPVIGRTESTTRVWQRPTRSVIGFTSADGGFEAVAAGTRLVGVNSGVAATVIAVDTASATITLDRPGGFFDDRERIETSAGIGATVNLEANGGDEEHLYRVLDLGDVEGADAATFAVLIQPTKGDVVVEGPLIYFRPDTARWYGRDAFLFEICDDEAACSFSFFGASVAERFTQGRAAQLLTQPGQIDLTIVNKADGSPDTATIVSSNPIGEFEYFAGPTAPLQSGGGFDEQRIRGTIDATDVALDFGSINDMLPGRIAIDSSGLINLIGLLGSPTDRIVFGLRGEDVSVQTKLDGLLVDDESNDLADYRGAGDCDDFIDFGCWLLFRIGATIDGRGDVTNTAADGFVALYEVVDLERPAGPGRGLVPRLTVPFEGLRRVNAVFEVELDLGCGLTCDVVFPLDIEVDLRAFVSDFELGFWDYGMDVCLPVIGECIDIDDPDYLEGEPWRLSFPLPLLGPGRLPSKLYLPAAPAGLEPLPLAETTLVRGGTVRVVLPDGTSDYQLLIYSSPVILVEGRGTGGQEIVATIPEWIEEGEHTLVLTTEVDGELVQFSATVTVVRADAPVTAPTVPAGQPAPPAPPRPAERPPPGPDPTAELPRTGTGVSLLRLALMPLVAGLLLLLVTRRRRPLGVEHVGPDGDLGP